MPINGKKRAIVCYPVLSKTMKVILQTQKDTARALGVSIMTLRRWRECPRVEISRRKDGTAIYRYNVDSVIAWLENRTQKGGEA